MSKFQEIINSDTPVLIDFHATWCGPCQAMSPIIKEIAKDVKGQAKVLKIDIDKNPKLSNALNIKGVPTFVIYQNGEIKWRASGMQSKTILVNEVLNLVKSE